MLDKDTIRAANYMLQSMDPDEAQERMGIDDDAMREFFEGQLEGTLRQVHAEHHEACAKQARGEKLTEQEEMMAEGLGDNMMRALLSSTFRFGMTLAHFADTQDLTEGREWVKEHPTRSPSEMLERLTNALGIDIAVIAVGPDGEATVMHHTGDPLTPEEVEEIKRDVKEQANGPVAGILRRSGKVSEAEKHRGM